jgi:hypothetical protein
MKKLIITAILGCLIFTACNDDDTFLYNEEAVARFLGSVTTLGEDETSPKAIVLVITGKNGFENGVSVQFSVEPINDAAAAGTTFSILNETNTLTFSNGISDTIWVKAVDNEDADGVKQLQITLTEGNVGLGLPGEAANFSTHIVNINDNDCALDMDNFAGPYNTCEIGYTTFDSPVSLGTTANTLVLENLGDWGVADAILTFNPDVSESTIVIENTQAGVLGGTTAVFWSGTGKYIACTGDFQVQYQIVFADGSPWAPGVGTDIYTVNSNPDCNPLF